MIKYKSDKVLEFSVRNHFFVATSVPFFIVSFILLLFWFSFDKFALLVFGIFFLIQIIPVLYLHIEYYLKNRGEKYEVNFDKLVRTKAGNIEVYEVGNIEKIKVYLSPALYKGSNFHLLGIEAYHYARVYLKNGEELIITCLLTPKVEKALRQLRGVKIESKKRLFNTLDWK